MKVHLSFVPPGGGETDYSLIIEMPTVPQTGDYISITRPGQQGAEDFIVKRTWWNLEYNNNNIGSTKTFGLNVNLLSDHIPVKSIEGAVMIIMLELVSFWSFINLCTEIFQ